MKGKLIVLIIVGLILTFNHIFRQLSSLSGQMTEDSPQHILQEMAGQKIIRGKYRTEQNDWAIAIGSATLCLVAGDNYVRESSEIMQNDKTVVCETILGYSSTHKRFELARVLSSEDSMLFLVGHWDASGKRLAFTFLSQGDSLHSAFPRVDYYFYEHDLFKKVVYSADNSIHSELLYIPNLRTE